MSFQPARITLYLPFALVVGICSEHVSAVTFTVSPAADTFVSAGNPNSNYGGGGALQTSAAGLPKGEFQGLMRFNLAGALSAFDGLFGAGGWRLDAAALRLSAANPNNPLFNASSAGEVAASWMQNDAWIEGTGNPGAPTIDGLTWNTLPSFLSSGDQSLGAFGFGGATSGTADYSLSPSSGLTADLLAGGTASIRLSAGDSTVSSLFNSRNNMTVASRPVLVLDAVQVPEPATIVLASLSGIFTAVKRRSRGAVK
jgi:hypothetical protein